MGMHIDSIENLYVDVQNMMTGKMRKNDANPALRIM